MATKTRTKTAQAFDSKAASEAIRHLDGCPEDPERAETYSATRPANEEHPRRQVWVTRCQDCGESHVDAKQPPWASGIEGDS